MTEQTDAAEARDPYLPDLDDETNLGLLIFEDATPGGTTKIIARILASDWLAAREAAARAEALREAADAWTQGAWSDVMLPKPTPPAVPVIAYSNRVGDWLRDRAAQVAPSRVPGEGS